MLFTSTFKNNFKDKVKNKIIELKGNPEAKLKKEETKQKRIEENKLKKEKAKAKRVKDAKERKEISQLINDWIEIMAQTKTDNQLDETFSLDNIKKEPYGFSCNINIVKGLSFSMLESEAMVKIIEDNLGCILVLKRVKKSTHLKAQFIMEDIPEIDFKPYKCKPWELYLGTSIDGEPIIVSMLKFPHLIVQGATGMGKTKMIDSVVTNLIVQNSPDDLSLYFIQADKSDQIIYRKCKHTRAYADDIQKALAITNYLKEVVESRDKLLRPLIEDGICENIYEYNKIYKKYKQTKFTYIYLIIDEYSSLMPGDSEDKPKKAIKNAIQENIERLIQIGRYVGIYVIVGLQRSTVDKLPSFIKAMCNTIATFRVNNERSSFVAIDSNEAVNLNPRESIIKTSEKFMAKTVTITPAMILEYTKDFRWTNGEYREFVYESWLSEVNNNKKTKKTSKNKKRKEERYKNNDNNESESKNNELTDDELNKLISKK